MAISKAAPRRVRNDSSGDGEPHQHASNDEHDDRSARETVAQ
jgi:hypothetical protein